MTRPFFRALCLAAGLMVFSSSQAMQRQEASNWCWAASIQDVMAQTGRFLPQAAISARLDGVPRDRPAYVGEVVGLLRSYGFRAWQAGRPATPDELAGTLGSGWRVIALARPQGGTVGHFIVLQAADPRTGLVRLSDPATGMSQVQPMAQLYQQWHWEDSVVVGAPMR